MIDLKFDRNRHRVKVCPCGKDNRDGKFVPYTGFESKGYCHSCGQTFLPKNGIDTVVKQTNLYKPIPTSFHEKKLVSESGRNFDKNNFIQQLKDDFPKQAIKNAIQKYLIGTSNHWKGATIFWQIDNNQNVRHGKIMLYDRGTGKRVKKDGKAYISSVRSQLKLKNHYLKQCLFGLHLINDYPNKKIAVVESEKTAVKMSMLMSQYNWLATGSKSLLQYKYLKEIRAFPIVLFPDKGAYENWYKISAKLESLGFNIQTSKWLEDSNYPENSDLADLLTHEETMKSSFKSKKVDKKKEIISTAEQKAHKIAKKNPLIYNLIRSFNLTDRNNREIKKNSSV